MIRISSTAAVVCALAVLCFAFCPADAVAQSLTQSKEQLVLPDFQSLKATLGQQPKGLDMGEGVPVDAPVNAAEYVVGPGDRLAFNVWSSAPVEVALTVAPEGVLIIPGVGIVDVKGLTLAQAKAKVQALAGKRYLHAEISLSLLVPRKVSVTILGYVLHEGKKSVYASQRVEDLIELGNEFPTGRMTADEYADKLNRMRSMRSERNILLSRRNGESMRVDLARYRVGGEGKYNPYLREGDVIYVPERKDMDNVIGVFGASMRNANFEFVQGDSLSLLVGMGMGFPTNADPKNAVLSRLSAGGTSMDTLHVDALAILEGRAADIALRPGDRLSVPAITSAAANYRVTIEGEVARAGTYPITRENTKLTEVIRMAGGFTPNANLAGAVVLRRKIDDLDYREIDRERLLSLRASLPVQDTSYYRVESTLRLSDEVVAVDFRELFVKGDTTRDVTLRTRDRIVVPTQQHSVYVFGQVVAPGYVKYEEGKEYNHYVDRAGGFASEARSSDVRIIKGGTRAWLDPDETDIEDGDMIWVPKETVYPFSHYVGIYAQIAGIIGTVATVALLVNSYK